MEIEKIRDGLKQVGKRVSELSSNITNEEQTKNAFIMPFFQALGYDIFNPLEFVPEFTADVGIKKGEKVDYAIIIDKQPQILIECKSINQELTKHDSQLFRYFGTTTSKFGLLTNGKEYKFFTDLDEPNKMDTTPFLIIDITDIKDNQFNEIIKFHKENFDIDNIVSSASELKYLNNLKSFLNENINAPTDSFLKYLVSEIYDGVKTQNVLDNFKPIIAKGFNQFINDRVNEKLSAALNTNVEVKETEVVSENRTTNEDELQNDIVTTPQELEVYTVVKMLLKDTIDPTRVIYRDNKSYFNVLIDNSVKKWIVRFRTNSKKSTIEVRNKGVFEINSPLDISRYQKKIIEAVTPFL
ncbi:type I restriction endonuclease [Streptococcus pseudoporcinus]|uniref:Type I restriction enzyme R protein, N-terminal domain protein n=1 Tax=Streptococcus pseudoporcinus LQ 940-04 TaxID=875093 RepID=G5K9Z4_9STRE|nr:type I restriction endonuclease [Streptococcus pseudoporcinus]EFR43567.1 type I restriction enzyme HsdR protein N-terminal domain protein [Streptococcus pseudoporcinus SPIN 20026]EHI65266.1 type I restriction enzyme R protein, N-terminal domain protein [Streptococcus pseudoporcinus LQ 940-04]VEF93737.1 type I restriction enzyme related protein [Streptococcus pseudoporcinus]